VESKVLVKYFLQDMENVKKLGVLTALGGIGKIDRCQRLIS